MTHKYRDYDHYDPETRLETVHEVWDDLRSQCPVGRSDAHGGVWVVTGYEEAHDVLHRPEVFSSHPASFPPFPSPSKMMPVEIDPPDHARYRALLAPPFSVKRAESYAEPLRVTVNNLIDEFIEAGEADLYQALALRLPAALATIMLGTPADDADKLQHWVDTVVHEVARDFDAAFEAVRCIFEYFWDLIEARQADPSGDDLVSVLLRGEINAGKLNEEELLGFCFFLLLASLDTTQKVIGSMFWHLATDPALRGRIAADPSLTPGAVEEFLRRWGSVINTRKATRDTEVGGCPIKEGDQLLVLLAAANRDGREFPDPTGFAIDRSPNRHLTFGSGIHRCLGAHIARVELRVLLDEFLRRIPDFEITDPALVEWSNGHVQGVVRLPVRFPAGARLR
ncbi:MAG TPA: cytochrome P450 [Acidimicrobiia bacterium]